MTLEVILSESSRLPHTGGSQAVPDHPSPGRGQGVAATPHYTRCALQPARGWPAVCLLLFNPSCKARSSAAANFIRSRCVWPRSVGTVCLQGGVTTWRNRFFTNCLRSAKGRGLDLAITALFSKSGLNGINGFLASTLWMDKADSG